MRQIFCRYVLFLFLTVEGNWGSFERLLETFEG
jgi:hypothetical protein